MTRAAAFPDVMTTCGWAASICADSLCLAAECFSHDVGLTGMAEKVGLGRTDSRSERTEGVAQPLAHPHAWT
jgi:hypothetical protein